MNVFRVFTEGKEEKRVEFSDLYLIDGSLIVNRNAGSFNGCKEVLPEFVSDKTVNWKNDRDDSQRVSEKINAIGKIYLLNEMYRSDKKEHLLDDLILFVSPPGKGEVKEIE
jgi:hypothetical protein